MIPYRPDRRKGILAVALLLGAIILVGSWPTVYHFIIHPLVTPRFEGVIVYVDSMNPSADVSGSITVRLDGVRIERREFFGQRWEQIVIKQPEEEGVWSVYVYARSQWQIRIRVVDGLTRQLLDEESQRREGGGNIGIPGELVLVALTYSRGEPG